MTEILEELEKLSPAELQAIQEKLDALQQANVDDESPEMLAAIDEGLRSLREEGSMTMEELIEDMKTWTLDSK